MRARMCVVFLTREVARPYDTAAVAALAGATIMLDFLNLRAMHLLLQATKETVDAASNGTG